ncbi:MAG: hypothetical protein IKR04_01130 [Clostridia bacterium]|nr:hypothetical protein [Clostridia bacterium]
MKKVLKYILTLVIAFLVGNLLLFLVCLIPRNAVEDNCIESASVLIERGPNFRFLGFFPCDNYTETEIINEAYSVDSTSPMYSYLTMRRCFDPQITENEMENPNGKGIELLGGGDYTKKNVDLSRELAAFLNGKVTTAVKYGRYWHGYMALYRPLLVFFNIIQIRLIMLAIIIIMLILIFNGIKKKNGLAMAVVFLITFCLGGLISGSVQFQLFPAIFLALLVGLLVLKNKVKFDFYFVFTYGIILNYFDYFTIPLFAICLPMIFYLLDNPQKSLKDSLFFIIKILILFFAGYALMWGAKILLYYFVVDKEFLEHIITQFFYRSSSYSELGINVFGRCINLMFVRLLLLIYPVMLMMLFRIKYGFSMDEIKNHLYLFFLAIIPFVYLGLLVNHTSACWTFTYKDIMTSGLALNIFMVKSRKWQ